MAIPSSQLRAGASALVRIFSPKPRTPPQQQELNLFKRLSAVGYTDGEVATAIDDYTKEGGKFVKKAELDQYIKAFRRFKRYRHILEVGEWMAQKFVLKPKDNAIHLWAIAKVKGIAAAENYFNDLPPSSRVRCTYEKLLNCYCTEKMDDKALDLFKKMTEQNMIHTPVPFNHLMMMHIRLGEPEKAIRLGEELKKANIEPNTSTCNLLMSSYSYLNDFEGVERVLKEMTVENSKLVNWTTYSNLANIYVQAGDHEKARMALKALEKEIGGHERAAYNFMISIYARMGDLDNVHRVWKSLKSGCNVIWNMNYITMIRTLDNLNDIDGLKECFEEWEKVCSNYDARLPSTVIGAYLRHDRLEEAESVLQSMLGKSKGHFFYACETLVNFYLKRHGVKQAMKIMEKATSEAVNHGWKPRQDTIDGFLDCFKLERDVKGAEELYKLMKRINCVNDHFYEMLLQIYSDAGQKLHNVRERIKRDGVEISSELEDLVASVSS
ncbi:pentatricopeptide repeat-containing protein At1g02370, mitochondrial-like [Salvia hispanica]|uniref:pentatricopeptide repeat-containing protein At1g02370, mitochondrial-like n=1 Tax=Salvia hispanica TaxID=49212 RepID=UPI0020097425|nr:pentatricopeptide repeat-containing protein At1g02370, mitochondrial-like [Salvia hispanica]